MTIYRTEHKKNYTTVNNFITRDKRISWRAKGIWLYAFSRPDDWVFSEENIIDNAPEGRDAVRSALSELKEFGYLHKEYRKDGTKFAKAEWVFYETPKEIKEMFTADGFSVNGNPSTEIQETEASKGVSSGKNEAAHTYIPSTEILSTDNKQQQQQVVVVEKDFSEEKSSLSRLVKSDVYRVGLTKGWDPAEIEAAFAAYQKITTHIEDDWAYIEGIINKKRIINQQKQGKEQCSTKNTLTQKKEPPLKNMSTNCKKNILAQDTSDHLLANFLYQEKLKRGLVPS
jgi:hypothetical protein